MDDGTRINELEMELWDLRLLQGQYDQLLKRAEGLRHEVRELSSENKGLREHIKTVEDENQRLWVIHKRQDQLEVQQRRTADAFEKFCKTVVHSSECECEDCLKEGNCECDQPAIARSGRCATCERWP